MAPVVKELAALPDEDIRPWRSISVHSTRARSASGAGYAGVILETLTAPGWFQRRRPARALSGRLCVCHQVGGAPLFGSRPSLALNSNLHSAVPDNLIQVILHGIASPVSSDLGYMPPSRTA